MSMEETQERLEKLKRVEGRKIELVQACDQLRVSLKEILQDTYRDIDKIKINIQVEIMVEPN